MSWRLLYQPIQPNKQGWLWSEQLGLYLGIWEDKLRYFTSNGELVPTPQEAAMEAQQRTEQLAAKLRELGINPDEI